MKVIDRGNKNEAKRKKETRSLEMQAGNGSQEVIVLKEGAGKNDGGREATADRLDDTSAPATQVWNEGIDRQNGKHPQRPPWSIYLHRCICLHIHHGRGETKRGTET